MHIALFCSLNAYAIIWLNPASTLQLWFCYCL